MNKIVSDTCNVRLAVHMSLHAEMQKCYLIWHYSPPSEVRDGHIIYSLTVRGNLDCNYKLGALYLDRS